MNQRKFKTFFTVIFFLTIFLYSFNVFSDEKSLKTVPTKFEFQLESALSWGNVNGNGELVGEYFTLKEMPRMTIGFNSSIFSENIFFRSELFYEHEDDQVYAAELYVKKIFKISFDHRLFNHRLVHDPLLFPTAQVPAYIQISDNNPDGIPQLTRGLTNFQMTSTNPSRKITYHVSYRAEEQKGERQIFSMLSSAKPWSVYGMENSTNRLTQDYEGGVTIRLGSVTLDDTFTYRSFNVRETLETNIKSGLNYSQVPEFAKWQNTFSVIARLPMQTSMFANYVKYSIDNDTLMNNFGVDGMNYDSFQLRVTSTPVRKLRINAFYRYQKTGSELNKWYNTDIPSILNRNVKSWGASAALRINRHTMLNYKYQRKTTERENAISGKIHPEETEKNSHKLSFKFKFLKKAKFRLEWKHDDVDNPFANLKMFSEANEYGETYPQLSCLATTNNVIRSQLVIPLSKKFNADIDCEWGKGDYKSGTNTQWSQKYQQIGLTLTYLTNSRMSFYFNLSLLTGDAYTYLAPDLADLEFVNNGIWTTGRVPYSDDIQTYSLGFVYQMSEKINFNGHIMYMNQEAASDTSSLTLMGLESFSKYSKNELNSMHFSLTSNYEIAKKTFLKILLIYGRYQNPIIYITDMAGTGWTGAIGFVWEH